MQRGIGRRDLEVQQGYVTTTKIKLQDSLHRTVHVEIGHVMYHVVFRLDLAEASIQKVYIHLMFEQPPSQRKEIGTKRKS